MAKKEKGDVKSDNGQEASEITSPILLNIDDFKIENIGKVRTTDTMYAGLIFWIQQIEKKNINEILFTAEQWREKIDVYLGKRV